MFRWASLVGLALAISGCATSSPLADFGDVPTWSVGDAWAFASEDGNPRREFVVQAVEGAPGNVTYRLSVSVVDGVDVYSGELWVRAQDLAIVRSKYVVFQVDIVQECGGLFPIENRTVDCRSENRDPHGTRPYASSTVQEIRVGQAGPLTVDAGTFDAREVTWRDADENRTLRREWYAPAVGWLAQFEEQGDLLGLESTTYRR